MIKSTNISHVEESKTMQSGLTKMEDAVFGILTLSRFQRVIPEPRDAGSDMPYDRGQGSRPSYYAVTGHGPWNLQT